MGLVGLLAAGIRFGPVRTAIERRRRSPLEHVRALATALAAARGHDVAVRLMIQGLRRRLSPPGAPNRGDLDGWLGGLAPSLRTERGREALAELNQLTHRQPSADEVLQAANDVETLWQELKPQVTARSRRAAGAIAGPAPAAWCWDRRRHCETRSPP